MTSLYWLQGGGCGGDTWAFLSSETPNLVQLCESLHIDLLWHASLSPTPIGTQRELEESVIAGDTPLDILVVEGAAIQGPDGTGIFDMVEGRPKRDLIRDLARNARFVVAAGTCAAFGGFGSRTEVQATGLQFHRSEPGGLLGADFRAGSGLPVINLAGCPCHHNVVAGTIQALASDIPLPLDQFNRPTHWYSVMVHQGCTRNEYHEYRVEEHDFAQKGCLFFHMGCRGPLVGGPCNRILWNQRSAKTRVGVPCFGCTDPEFPQNHRFFHTRNIEGIPLELPMGVDRAHYMAYKGMAAAAAPKRLRDRSTEV